MAIEKIRRGESKLSMIEIERKFLVTSEGYKLEAYRATKILQGFLNSDPNRTVRVRVMGDRGYLTVKGISNTSGTSRFEWEREIPKKEAEALLLLCEPGVIEKMRYELQQNQHTFEVDEFLGANEGLVIAELELASETETYERPSWLGEEVTGDIKYYNSQLAKEPYTQW